MIDAEALIAACRFVNIGVPLIPVHVSIECFCYRTQGFRALPMTLRHHIKLFLRSLGVLGKLAFYGECPKRKEENRQEDKTG